MKQIRDLAAEAMITNDHRWLAFQSGFGAGWQIWCQPLITANGNPGERFSWTRKILIIDSTSPDLLWRAMHSAAHIRLAHRTHRRFTPAEEDRASECADFWAAWTADGTIHHIAASTAEGDFPQ